MASRNVEQTAREVPIPGRYDLTYQELMQLLGMLAKHKPVDAIYAAFRFGFAVGQRAKK